MQKYIVKNDKVFQHFKDDLFEGFAPIVPPVPTGDPWITFIGTPMLIDPPKDKMGQGLSWREVQAFFQWVYDTSKSEAQVRCYLNQEKKMWRFWAFPQQEGTGMTTQEIPEQCDTECQKVGLHSTKGWIEGGSIHSHCSATAWQSSVDSSNEQTKNGVHITIGKVDKVEHDLHGRVSFRGVFYDIMWSNWFLMPEGLDGLPFKFHESVMQYFLAQAPPDDYPFPKEWKDNIIKKVYSPRPYQIEQGESRYGGSPAFYKHDPKWKYNKDTGCYQYNPDGHAETKEEPKKEKLSKKEAKRIKKLMHQREFTGTVDEAVKVHNAATEVIRSCVSNNVEVSHLFMLVNLPSTEQGLRPEEKQVLDDLEDIVHKHETSIDDVEEWILLTEEESGIPFYGG